MLNRRGFLRTTGAVLLTASFGGLAGAAATAPVPNLSERLRALEAESGGRLGVAALDTRDGRHAAWRADERFPMCSTFKLLLAAAILREVDAGRVELTRRLPIAKADLVPHAPFTEKRIGSSASIAELCEAIITLSDNPAANLLLPLVGGPAGLTKFLRELGDPTTRLDRVEPALNSAIPGDPRDTTSPAAMVATMQTLLLGEALRDGSKKRLITWLMANRTGDRRLRAGLPAGAGAGDKTGSGNDTTNDVAIVWPAGRPPVLLACFLTGSKQDGARRDAILASAARAVFEAWEK